MTARTTTAVRLATAGAAMLAVAGCSTVAGRVTPHSFASPQTSSPDRSELILAALNGGILPANVSETMSRSDRLRALEAEYKALESAPGGLPFEWKSPGGDVAGKVVAATPYQVGQQNCRQYTHDLVIEGQTVSGQGAACRNPDGSWTPLT